jgi:hypothetical protein
MQRCHAGPVLPERAGSECDRSTSAVGPATASFYEEGEGEKNNYFSKHASENQPAPRRAFSTSPTRLPLISTTSRPDQPDKPATQLRYCLVTVEAAAASRSPSPSLRVNRSSAMS